MVLVLLFAGLAFASAVLVFELRHYFRRKTVGGRCVQGWRNGSCMPPPPPKPADVEIALPLLHRLPEIEIEVDFDDVVRTNEQPRFVSDELRIKLALEALEEDPEPRTMRRPATAVSANDVLSDAFIHDDDALLDDLAWDLRATSSRGQVRLMAPPPPVSYSELEDTRPRLAG